MNLKVNLKKIRRYKVGLTNIEIKDMGNIQLKANEQITFVNKKTQYDVCKKNWGYYATPSLNKRLKSFNFRSFLVKNPFNCLYLMIVEKSKINLFHKYLKKEKNKIVKEFTNIKCK